MVVARATALLYVVGMVFALITYVSGTWAADAVTPPAEAQTVLTEHAYWARFTIWYFGIYGVVRLVIAIYSDTLKLGKHLLLMLVAAGGIFMLFEMGEHGAKLVFGYQVGTGQLVDHGEAADRPTASTGWSDTEDGMRGVITPRASKVLNDHFTFIQGGAMLFKQGSGALTNYKLRPRIR